MLQNIELYILLFFTYSFAGWFMESVGGILNVKKFINRGFLIGPYCPVYGVGVVIVSILLKEYVNDIPALFVLSTVICGTLEYFTSYIMEKLFNARWWDYKNNKFNINGRICLETLLPFGIAATLILKYINPFFFGIYLGIPDTIRHIITIVFSVIFVSDCIISFRIILSFKDEIYANKDNTEEIVEKVKDKTEDVLMKAESDAIIFTRRLKVKELKLQRKFKRYTRDKFSENLLQSPRELAEKINKQREILNNKLIQEKEKIDTQVKLRYSEIELKQKEKKEYWTNTIQKRRDELEEFQKSSKELVDNTIKNIKMSSEEFTNQVKEKFKAKSLLRSRLMDAFPTMQVKDIKNKDKKIDKKKNNKS